MAHTCPPIAQWPEDEHSWFVSMRERYWREMGPRGASREALMKKLVLLMPKYSVADLVAHDELHQKHKLLLVSCGGLGAPGMHAIWVA